MIRWECDYAEGCHPALLDALTRTNQLFPVLPDAHLAKLADRHVWSFWEKVDADHTAVRFCTSWCTTPEQAEQLAADLKGLSQHP